MQISQHSRAHGLRAGPLPRKRGPAAERGQHQNIAQATFSTGWCSLAQYCRLRRRTLVHSRCDEKSELESQMNKNGSWMTPTCERVKRKNQFCASRFPSRMSFVAAHPAYLVENRARCGAVCRLCPRLQSHARGEQQLQQPSYHSEALHYPSESREASRSSNEVAHRAVLGTKALPMRRRCQSHRRQLASKSVVKIDPKPFPQNKHEHGCGSRDD